MMTTKLLAALIAKTINGTNQPDNLHGTSGNDNIYGLSGSDTLFGGDGNDVIDGGPGADRMFGGAGNDTYVVDNVADRPFEAADEGIDTVLTGLHLYSLKSLIENLTFTDSGPHMGRGSQADNTITGNSGKDILLGEGGNDTLYGMGGADQLFGGKGRDYLDGGAGADRMFGGDGNDTYVVDSRADRIFESKDSGIDTVLTLIGGKLGDNLENMTLTGDKMLDATGNESNNTLIGNDARNTLSGLDGNDTLDGGLGKDILIGGNGADHFVFSTEPNASTNVDTISDFSSAGGDWIVLDASVFKAFHDAGSIAEAQFYAADGANKAHDGNNRIIYDTKSGALYYDDDGLGGDRAVQFAVVGTATHPALTFADIHIVL